MPYLVESGLLSEEQVADGGLVVDAVPRRHQNLRVTLPRGSVARGFFLEQADELSVRGVDSVATEGRFHVGLARARPALAASVPALVRYDDDLGVVVLELLPDHRSVRELVAAEAPTHFPSRMWRRV